MQIYRQRMKAVNQAQQQRLVEQQQRGQYLRLDFDARQRGRFRARCQDGTEVAIDLPRGEILNGGTVVTNEDGALLEILAASQSLMQVTAEHDFELIKAAYHLGNRHVRLMIARSDNTDNTAALYFEPDEVLADMLHHLAVQVTRVERAFEPENGAYHRHEHQHSHHHGQQHHHQLRQPDAKIASVLQGATWSAVVPQLSTPKATDEAND